MIRSFATLLTAGLAGAAALALALPQDYESIPEPIDAAAAKVHASPLKLSDALARAEQEVGGLAREARLLLDRGVAEVWVYTQNESWRVQVGADGRVLEKKKDVPFVLPGAPVTGEPTVTTSGLKYYDLMVGSGETPPSPAAQVKVHYIGWLLDGKKFESTVDRGHPTITPLNQVIPGWTEGIGSMKVGGKRKLIIPYALAYGPAGKGPIPPKATLVFDVELLEIVRR